MMMIIIMISPGYDINSGYDIELIRCVLGMTFNSSVHFCCCPWHESQTVEMFALLGVWMRQAVSASWV